MEPGDLTLVVVTQGHASEDTFINKRHSERLAAAYAGDSNLVSFAGDHNSVRPQFFYSSVLIFFDAVLQCSSKPAPLSTATSSVRYGAW